MTPLDRRFIAESAGRVVRGMRKLRRRVVSAVKAAMSALASVPRVVVTRSGFAEQPVVLRWLVGLVASLAAIVVAVGLNNINGLPAAPHWLLVGVGAVVLSQIAMLRVRTTGGTMSIGWGEAALIICAFVVPLPWVPVVFAVGAVVAHIGRFASGRWPTPIDAVRNAAAITVGGAAGAAIAGIFTTTHRAAFTPTTALALCAGAIGYFAVTAGFAAASAAGRWRVGYWPLYVQLIRNKLLMGVGNIAVGLAVVAMLGADWRWVLLLPPLLWLLQQTYSHRLRADDERRTWQAFVGATKALNQLDEPTVAAAGAAGALRLCAASVECADSRNHG